MPPLQMHIRAYRGGDRLELLRMSQALAPQYAVEEHANDLRSASDALLNNDVSILAHERSGYQVVDRVVQFRKPLVSENRGDRAT